MKNMALRRLSLLAALVAAAWVVVGCGNKMADETNRNLDQLYAGFNAYGQSGDVEQASAPWADDSVRIHPAAGEIHGGAGVREFYKGLYEGFADQKLVESNRVIQGRKFSTEFTWSATHRESKKPVKLLILLQGEYNDQGKIARATEMFDTGAFMKQLQ